MLFRLRLRVMCGSWASVEVFDNTLQLGFGGSKIIFSQLYFTVLVFTPQ